MNGRHLNKWLEKEFDYYYSEAVWGEIKDHISNIKRGKKQTVGSGKDRVYELNNLIHLGKSFMPRLLNLHMLPEYVNSVDVKFVILIKSL